MIGSCPGSVVAMVRASDSVNISRLSPALLSGVVHVLGQTQERVDELRVALPDGHSRTQGVLQD